mmetsp:Transcript_42651/g.49400  ORF Transcript_42651/g.49400 Transcript_42651/m.49400 type:complete len:162 (+) Transcript_42651:3-488(+)
MCQRKLTDEIKDQIQAFKKGFHILIPEKALELMGPGDLEYIIAGEQEYNLAQWRETMKYREKITETDELVQWFWEILETFTNEELGQYLYFVTGSSRVPFGGFTKSNLLELQVLDSEDTTSFPIGHTCSNLLEIPRYKDKETMREKLLIAMTQGTEGFYIS